MIRVSQKEKVTDGSIYKEEMYISAITECTGENNSHSGDRHLFSCDPAMNLIWSINSEVAWRQWSNSVWPPISGFCIIMICLHLLMKIGNHLLHVVSANAINLSKILKFHLIFTYHYVVSTPLYLLLSSLCSVGVSLFVLGHPSFFYVYPCDEKRSGQWWKEENDNFEFQNIWPKIEYSCVICICGRQKAFRIYEMRSYNFTKKRNQNITSFQ